MGAFFQYKLFENTKGLSCIKAPLKAKPHVVTGVESGNVVDKATPPVDLIAGGGAWNHPSSSCLEDQTTHHGQLSLLKGAEKNDTNKTRIFNDPPPLPKAVEVALSKVSSFVGNRGLELLEFTNLPGFSDRSSWDGSMSIHELHPQRHTDS